MFPDGRRWGLKPTQQTFKPALKTEAFAIKSLLESHGITHFYHFTDRRNLPFITEHGLYSWQYIEDNGLNCPAPGGNEPSRENDLAKGLQDYVRLSFCERHPMLHAAKADGRLVEVVVLLIDPEVATWRETSFADRNTASVACRVGKTSADLSKVRFDLVRLDSRQQIEDPADAPFFQAEVMVKTHIPWSYVKEVKHVDRVSASAAQNTPFVPVRFSADRWRYHKECVNFYKDPVRSFFLELLQNSLDACSRPHSQGMHMSCDIVDIDCVADFRTVKRVQVTIEDNGCGMDERTVREGLLRMASTANTRTDAGRKTCLGDCAGGFGLAKALLFLGQDSFEVLTKTENDAKGIYVHAEFGRHDQENAKMGTVEHYLETVSNALPCNFQLRRGDHGTWIRIILNPWVMAPHQGRAADIDENCMKTDSIFNAEQYKAIARQVYQSCNIPMKLTLNQSELDISCDIGSHICDLHFPTSCETELQFASVYAKEVDEQHGRESYDVVLQVLRQHGQSHFLHCFNKEHGTPSKRQHLTVVLLTEDPKTRAKFQVKKLLHGTRDRLTSVAQFVVDNCVQKFLIDPNLVKPAPESMILLVPADNTFSEWFENKCNEGIPERTPEYWRNLTPETSSSTNGWSPDAARQARNVADEHLRTSNWRNDLRYKLFIFKKSGIFDDNVPAEFKAHENLKAADVMWLEIYGAYVHAALEALQQINNSNNDAREASAGDTGGTEADLLTGKFDIGFIVTEDKERSNCPNLGPVGGKFLMSPSFSGRPADDCTDSKLLKKAVFKLKSAAIHQVAHMQVKEHNEDFIEHIENLTEAMDEIESIAQQSWFHIYRRHLEDRVMRDVQSQTPVPALVRQMAAVESAAHFQKDSTATAAALNADLENVRRMMEDAFAGRDLTGREAKLPLVEQMRLIAEENQELRMKNKRLSTYKTILCRHYERGACSFGDQCTFAHGRLEIRSRVPE